MKTITSDSETALINTINNNFSNAKKINCFFHYKSNIIKNVKQLGLCNKNNKNVDVNITKKIINDNTLLTLSYNGNLNYVMNKIKDLSKVYPFYYNFLNEYFIKNKSNFFKIIA